MGQRAWQRMTALIGVVVGVALLASSAAAAAPLLDFGWSPPVLVQDRPGKKAGATHLLWPIQIVNSSERVMTPGIEVIAVINTGRQYFAEPRASVVPEGPNEEILSLDDLRTEMFPQVRRRAVAVFDKVDPRAQGVQFYVRGLVRPGPRTVSGGVPYVRVSFQKVDGQWVWVSTEFLE